MKCHVTAKFVGFFFAFLTPVLGYLFLGLLHESWSPNEGCYMLCWFLAESAETGDELNCDSLLIFQIFGIV